MSTIESQFSTYEDVEASDFPGKVLWEVIARKGLSKRYTDLVPLDGGTVGIANFATGGLASLYREMDTQKYFSRSQQEMISDFSSACRPPGKAGNDTGWGCFSKTWWHDGMKAFLSSPESEATQRDAWLKLMKPVIEAALSQGWRDQRSLAIATGIANSVGAHGFEELASTHNWRPDEVLTGYVQQKDDDHRKRRRDALNEAFPTKK